MGDIYWGFPSKSHANNAYNRVYGHIYADKPEKLLFVTSNKWKTSELNLFFLILLLYLSFGHSYRSEEEKRVY